MTLRISLQYRSRVLGSGLAAIINLQLFLLQISFVRKTEQILHDPILISFLAVISIFCLAEGWAGSARYEVIEFNYQNYTDIGLAVLTGVILFATFSISLAEYLVHNVNSETAPIFVGVVLVLLGVILRVSAFWDLESAFVSLPRTFIGQKLVEKGVYRFVRHPSEIGLICISFGVVWLMSSIVGFLLLVLILLPISYIRIVREENYLAYVFRERHTNYINKTPAIIPIIWSK